MESKAASRWRLKATLLAFMAVQNASLNLLARWSHVSSATSDAPAHAKTTVVVTCEALKILVALLLFANEEGTGIVAAVRRVVAETMEQPLEAAKLLVPSTLYVVQNNLVLVAAENLEGPVMAVFSQAKILTTAVFSIVMLGRELNARQWLALVVLAGGVSAVQVSMMEAKEGEGDAGEKNVLLGLFLTLCACCTSGFAGVYFEKVLKGSKISVWVRNVHLAAVGVLMGSVAVYSKDRAAVAENGFFAGYTSIVWALVLVQAGGGLLVAAVVKYTDNILKAFATSVAIVLASFVSILFFNFPVRSLFFFGAAGVIYAIFLYGDQVQHLPLCKAMPLILGGAPAVKVDPRDVAPLLVASDVEQGEDVTPRS